MKTESLKTAENQHIVKVLLTNTICCFFYWQWTLL